jgi:predicted GIY-YIG superfamily endonuclease
MPAPQVPQSVPRLPVYAVYVVRCTETGRFKIGVSNGDGSRRLAELQAAAPTILELIAISAEYVGAFGYERDVHQRLRKHRHHSEWFNPTPAVLEWAQVFYELVEAQIAGGAGGILGTRPSKPVGQSGGQEP